MATVMRTAPAKAWTFDLLAGTLDQLRIHPASVLHVGAHHGEEVPYYRAAGIERIHLVEPDPDHARRLRDAHPDIPVTQAAVGYNRGRATFYRNAFTPYSGLSVNPRKATTGTFVVQVVQVADLQGDHPELLVIDVQGAEMDALASTDLSPSGGVRVAIVEAADLAAGPGVYAAPAGDLVAYMDLAGFRYTHRWNYERSPYYDAVFVRRTGA